MKFSSLAFLILATVSFATAQNGVDPNALTALVQDLKNAGATVAAEAISALAATGGAGADLVGAMLSSPTTFVWPDVSPLQLLSDVAHLVPLAEYHTFQGTINPSVVAASPNHTVVRSHLTDTNYVHLEGGQAQAAVFTINGGSLQILNQQSPTTLTAKTTSGNLTFLTATNTLTPPGNLTSIISAQSNLSSFGNALNSAGRTAPLMAANGVTIFAPLNNAISDKDQLKNQNGSVISQAIDNYVIPGASVYSTGFTAGQHNSGSGSFLSFSNNGTTWTVRSGKSSARIIQSDILLNNGVLHIIDNVLVKGPATATGGAQTWRFHDLGLLRLIVGVLVAALLLISMCLNAFSLYDLAKVGATSCILLDVVSLWVTGRPVAKPERPYLRPPEWVPRRTHPPSLIRVDHRLNYFTLTALSITCDDPINTFREVGDRKLENRAIANNVAHARRASSPCLLPAVPQPLLPRSSNHKHTQEVVEDVVRGVDTKAGDLVMLIGEQNSAPSFLALGYYLGVTPIQRPFTPHFTTSMTMPQPNRPLDGSFLNIGGSSGPWLQVPPGSFEPFNGMQRPTMKQPPSAPPQATIDQTRVPEISRRYEYRSTLIIDTHLMSVAWRSQTPNSAQFPNSQNMMMPNPAGVPSTPFGTYTQPAQNEWMLPPPGFVRPNTRTGIRNASKMQTRDIPNNADGPSGDSSQPVTIDAETAFWITYNTEAEAFDREHLDAWNKTLDVLLIFAGLFSAINTAFILESYQGLQPDPSDITNRLLLLLLMHRNDDTVFTPSILSTLSGPAQYATSVNCLYFTSLACSLMAAFGAVTAKQWLTEYASIGSILPQTELGTRRQEKWDGMIAWRFPVIMAILPILLQLSLFLFLIGTVQFLWPINTLLAVLFLVLFVGSAVLFFGIMAIGIIYPSSPFQTPVTRFLQKWYGRTFDFVKEMYKATPSLKRRLTGLSSHSKRSEASEETSASEETLVDMEEEKPTWDEKDVMKAKCALWMLGQAEHQDVTLCALTMLPKIPRDLLFEMFNDPMRKGLFQRIYRLHASFLPPAYPGSGEDPPLWSTVAGALISGMALSCIISGKRPGTETVLEAMEDEGVPSKQKVETVAT
ncbi:hypothetical protein FRB99_007028, partial [Tulasnella sp. 403]